MIKQMMICSASIAVAIACQASAAHADPLGAFIDACTPITATGPDIRADMIAGGWTPQSAADASQDLLDLVSAHLHALRPGTQEDQVPAAVTELATAFRASLTDPNRGQMYTTDGAVAVALTQGENLSCFWAGPDDATFAELGAEIGSFPPLDEVFTISSVTSQEEPVEAGRDWLRNTKFSRVADGTEIGPYTVIVRIDRSPA